MAVDFHNKSFYAFCASIFTVILYIKNFFTPSTFGVSPWI